MIPMTLHPLNCSRAELSVRMGRSLKLLKPYREDKASAVAVGRGFRRQESTGDYSG